MPGHPDETHRLTHLGTASETVASVCNLVLCESSTLLKFWLDDNCREKFLSFLPRGDLANLRLACHDFSVRAAPALFSDLSITFTANAFTRPSRLAALGRLGFYVKTLRFSLPHTAEMFLPPLVEPDTGAELSFTYTPQTQEPSTRTPKYGDIGTTEILTRQYPPLFHAATNVSAFIRAFSALINLEHLMVCCPGYDASQRYRRSVVDYALISLRIAVEKNCLNALDSLTLSPIHPGGLNYLSPFGLGSSPRSASRWSRIKYLKLQMVHLPSSAIFVPEQCKLLRSYLRSFRNLATFDFRWLGERGPLPLYRSVSSTSSAPCPMTVHRAVFPKIARINVGNIAASAIEIGALVSSHKHTVEEIDLHDVDLTDGTWDDALAPLNNCSRHRTTRGETADIPIMLSLDTCAMPSPAPRGRAAAAHHAANSQRKSLKVSKWLSSKKPSTTQKMKDGLLGCEEQLRKVLSGSVFPWR